MYTRLFAVLFTLVVVVPVGAAIVRPTWANAVGLDVWNLPTLHHQIDSERERDRDLCIEQSEVLERIELKEKMIDRLLSGNSTLAETSEQFLAMDREKGGFLEVILEMYPGASDEEKMANNIIRYALPRILSESFAESIATLARLDQELQKLRDEQAMHRSE